jgi:hypothetical protein
MAAMMVVIEVHLAPGRKAFELSKETLEETKAQVMTPAEAARVGFEGLPPAPADHAVFYVAVRQVDSRWIMNALEADQGVTKFNVHEVG